MKIYNYEKTQELNENEVDLEKGYLQADKIFVKHHDAVEAKPAVYGDRIEILPNGSKQNLKPLITPAVSAKEEWDEYEDIQVYILYTKKELAEREIHVLKTKLSETDYRAIKYAEGEMTAQEYAETKEKRSAWRARINELEEAIK